MKRLLWVVLVVVALSSCSAGTPLAEEMGATRPVPTLTERPASVLQPIPVETPTSPSAASFAEPEPETWVMLMPAVEEYFFYRKKAVVSEDAGVLWARYPSLKEGKDVSKGINAEEFVITSYRTLKVFDGNIFPEHYERIKVKVAGTQAQVLVHGMELYLWKDETGNFTDSGGEFKVILFLEKKEDHWEVYKTDEVTMAEWHEFSP